MNLEDLNKVKIIEVLEMRQAKNPFVITPSSILKPLGFPLLLIILLFKINLYYRISSRF
ncbi:hypothetical protein SAMN05880574_13320 [Chryseobacterium sp. RU37D]|nr:hypothetical protein SAMN05880574_13320 [Chryseobacterium sp. RU37D]